MIGVAALSGSGGRQGALVSQDGPLLEFRRQRRSPLPPSSLAHYNRSLYNFRPAASIYFTKEERKCVRGRVKGRLAERETPARARA